MSYFLKRLYVYYFGMYLASNQSGIWNDLSCQEAKRGHCVFVTAKFKFCNRLSIFSLCFWRLILNLHELGFASLKGNLIQTRRTIASVTIHTKGPIWYQFVFQMAKYHIFVHTLYFNCYFRRYSL